MSFYNQTNRLDNPNQQLNDKDSSGRYLTNLLMEQLGYKLLPSEEKYDAGDDIFIKPNGAEILTETRTNVRLWDACIEPNQYMTQWVRRNRTKSDLYVTWCGITRNQWIGAVVMTDDVIKSPTKQRGSCNVNGTESVRCIPFNAVKMICTVTALRNNTTRIEYWDYRKHAINAWHKDIIPTYTIITPNKIDDIVYKLQPFSPIF